MLYSSDRIKTWFCAVVLLLHGCAWLAPQPGIGAAIPWERVPGWHSDRHAEAWPALRNSCGVLRNKDPRWQRICLNADQMDRPDDDTTRRFFENWFEPHPLRAGPGRSEGIITGYYEPILRGSFERDTRYRYPVFRRPHDLLIVDLADLYPELKGKRVRGRLEGNRVVPYHDRRELDSPSLLPDEEVLLWVDDPVDLFFLHIQGSGRIRLDDGKLVAVGFADQNGHPYRSIGRELIQRGELRADEVDMFSIRAWLKDHPDRARDVLYSNPSYVFFTLRDAATDGPVGALQVPLTPERSIAVDRSVVPLGTPVWLDTTVPANDGQPGPQPYRRLVLAQDTGGAIKGYVRADLFWGRGQQASYMAGKMKQEGRIYVLLPKGGD